MYVQSTLDVYIFCCENLVFDDKLNKSVQDLCSFSKSTEYSKISE